MRVSTSTPLSTSLLFPFHFLSFHGAYSSKSKKKCQLTINMRTSRIPYRLDILRVILSSHFSFFSCFFC